MKRTLLFLSALIALAFGASAQCTVDSSHFTPGTIVYPASLPCIHQSQSYSGTVNIRIPDSLDAHIFFSALPANTYFLYVDSIRLDSITGAPSGVSTTANPGSGTWMHAGQYGCVQVSGTTAAAIGSYPLSLFGAGCVHGTIGGFPIDSCQTGQLPNFINYSLDVCAALPPVCTPDTAGFAAGAFASPASLPCITQGSAYAGTISIRIPDSVDAHLFDNTYPAGFYYVHIDSIALDSIVGAPAGVSLAINPGSSTYLHPGEFGCVQVSGTTTAAVGNYALGVAGHGCFHVQLAHHVADSCISGLLPAYFSYNLAVCAPTICTPDTAHFTNGVFFYPQSLPCILQGAPYAESVSLKIPDSIDAHLFVSALPAGQYYLHIDSMRIDSVTGTPHGISVVTNPGDSVWLHGGAYGCALVSGTTTDSVGNYPINLFGRGCVHGNIFGIAIDSCVSGNLGAYLRYSLNVCNTQGACTVDTTHFTSVTHVYPASLPCITTGTAYSGQINIQVPASIDAHDFQPLIPAGQAVIYIDSININSITGYPAGITSISNPVLTSWLQPLSYACAHVTGTVNAAVTPAGNYNLTISGIACGHGTFPLIGTIDTCMQFNFTQVYPYRLSVCYPAGIAEIQNGVELTIYPNPNQGNFTVALASADRIAGQLAVVDQIGRTIHTEDIDVTGSTRINMNLGNVAAGVYILMINSANGRMVRQFVVR